MIPTSPAARWRRLDIALVSLAVVLTAGCGQPRVEEVPVTGTSSDNPIATDSVYGTPPDPIPTDPAPPPATASPTGREPRLIWTAARQATWNRMVQEQHPRFLHIKSKCDRAKSGSPAYGDRGLWCALYYQMTGDLSAARTAWTIVAPSLTGAPANANDVRENYIENALLFDWLYPALNATEQAQAIAGLNTWANYVLAVGTPAYVGGMRTGDSDAMVGYYFGLAAADLATRGMAGHVDWLDASQSGGPGYLPVGNLTATGINRSTARNTIAEYATVRAAGGQWIESSGYDPGTVVLLVMGVEAIRTAIAPQPDPFPEVQQFFREAIDFNIQIVTPDLRSSVHWGDEQHPHQFQGRLFKRVAMLGQLAGATAGSIESGRAMGLIDALAQQYGWEGYGALDPWARFYLFYDPYAPRAAWQSTPTHTAAGRGHLVVRTANTLFSGMMVPPSDVDHQIKYLSDFQLYRNGEWALTHPFGYAGPAVEGESTNGLLTAGLSAMVNRGIDRVESGTGWWAVTGSTGGSHYDAGSYYNPPPPFLNMWQRTVVYLQRNGVDHVVTVDRVDMQDPRQLPSFDRYRSIDQTRITGARGLLEWIIHMPVPPTNAGNRWSWQTPGGQPVTVTALGAMPTAHVIDEMSLGWTSNFPASELKYQLRLVPPFTGGQTVLRHVVTVGNAAPAITVSGDTITIDGVQVIVTANGVQVIG